jgi:tetratricopeptide (TPR) repeat protein
MLKNGEGPDMKKSIFILILCGICALQSYSQVPSTHELDNLRKALPSLKGIARVDCLNEISKSHLYAYVYNTDAFNTRSDSMIKFATQAYNEANSLGYKYGMGLSLVRLAHGESMKGYRDSKMVNKDTVQNRLKRAMNIAEEIDSDLLLGYVYLQRSEQADWNKAATCFRKAGNKNRELEALTYIVWNYTGGEGSVEGIDYAERAIQVAQVIKPANNWDQELVQWAYSNMSELYKTAGDYETSMEFVKKSDSIGAATNWMREYYNMTELNYLLGKYDSANRYWDLWKKDYATYHFGYKAKGDLLLAKICIKKGEYDKAIAVVHQGIDTLKKYGKKDRVQEFRMVRPLLGLGEAYVGKKAYKTALEYARNGVEFAKKKNDKLGKMEGYELMSRIYHGLGNNDSAYWYVRSYMSLKDSLQNKQFIWRLNNYKKAADIAKNEMKIISLNKDNKIKAEQLKEEASFKKFLIAAILAILFAGLYVYRNLTLKRKNEKMRREQAEQEWRIRNLESQKIQTELQRQAAELEMQALRAQMNPHFIFNCLSSINRFILKNESKAASNYLTRFSRLIRMVLINSQKPLITLEDELQMLRLYLDMERLRFKDSFDFSISFLNVMDDDNIFIPPLLLQPFCENAIWHGLMHKDGHGRLEINLSLENNILYCTITDDGIGRDKAEVIKSKSAEREKSMGLKITAERLALLNREKGVHTSYEMEDLLDEEGNPAGTKVHLRISYLESVKQSA